MSEQDFSRSRPPSPSARHPRAGEVMDAWLAGRRKITPSTRKSYEIYIKKYLKPALGDYFFRSISVAVAQKMFDDIEAENKRIIAKRATQAPLQRGQPAPRGYETRRPLSPLGLRRLRATARAIWNSPLAAELGVRDNPFKGL